MKCRAIALTLLVSLAPATLPFPKVALAADDATTKAARARFQEGVEHYDRGRYEAARASFLQAYALKKHPAVLLNLGQSCVRSGHPLEGAKYIQQFLRESSNVSATQRTDAEKGLADARKKIGRIEVSAPTNSEIQIDGEKVGTAPLSEPVDVDTGTHTVRVRTETGFTDQQTLAVTAGQKAVARFTNTGPTPPPVSPSAPVGSSAALSATDPTPPPDHAEGASSPGVFSAPKTYVPVVLGGIVAVGGFGTALAFGILKGKAQDNADSVADLIRSNGGGDGICASTNAADVKKFGAACKTLVDNNKTVDTDATVANIGLIAGGVGAATALGWLLFGPKRAAGPDTTGKTVVTPVFGGNVTGVSVSGSF